MANDYNASVVISTKESEAGIRSLDSAAKDLDKTLQNLHKSLKAGQGDLDKVAASMKALTDDNRALIKSEQDRAKATLLAAKADGQTIVNQSKRQTSANQTAIAEAKVAKLRQATVTAGKSGEATIARRDAESRTRAAATEAVTQARVASELTRGAVAQANLAAATTRAGSAADMAASRTARLADRTRAAASGTLELNDSLSNSRYLLYDVGQTYTVLALALQAIPVATAAVAIAYEKDFAQVIRTNDTLAQGNGFGQLREDLKQLATEIPLTFGQFSEIATIGGQLGIAGDDVSSFTETVARFGAASNVSIDQAATAFGRLQNSYDPLKEDANFFNKVGSAVAYVGVKSAATEAEIIAVNNQISAAGAQFGFAADEIVGLSGALASVRIRPELARGAFQRIMLGLSRAADDGAESFDKFGKYTGLAAEESMALFKTDPSAFFYKYIGGLKATIKETGSVSGVLDDIGAKNVFDKQFILGLSNGYNVFGDALNNASTAFNEGTFLNSSTQGVFDTMDAKIKRIGASIQNLADTVAKGSIGQGSGLAMIADGLLNVTGALDRFAQATPGFTTFLNIVLGLGSAIGILLAFKAAQAFVLAGLVGFQQVLGKGTLAAGLTAKGIIQQVAVTMLMAKGVSQAHAQALVVQSGAFKVMGLSAQQAAVQVAAMNAASGTVTRNVGQATSAAGRFSGALGATAKGALGLVGGPIGGLLLGLSAIALGFVQAEEKANSAGDAIARAMRNGDAAGKQAIGNELTSRTVDSFITDVGSGGTGNHGKNVRELAKEVGISFDDIVNSVSKGENAAQDFGKVLDSYSQKKGFKDFADLQSKSLTNLTNKKGELQFLSNVVDELGRKHAAASEDIDAVDKAAGKAGDTAAGAAPEMSELTGELEGVGSEAETASDKLDKFLNSIFGIVDANSATQSALQQLGEGLAESSDFGSGSEGGRENIANFQEALRAAALEQQMLIETTGKTTQQASADYIAFVEGLVGQMVSRGVDPTNVQALAEQAKGYFGATIAAGPKPVIEVDVDPAQAAGKAYTATEAVREVIGTNPLDILIGANTDGVGERMRALAEALAEITGIPYSVVVDALTDPAHEKSKELYALITSITNQTYTAPIGADTSAAITNVRNFAAYAREELNSLAATYNSLAKKDQGAANSYLDNSGMGSLAGKQAAPATAAPVQVQSRPVAVPSQVAAKPSAAPNFGALAGGYDKVRAAAKDAGGAGKQAGNDMADGIKDAARAADDYADRLKTGLNAAFEAQYGMQKATDDYYSALNAITKKRDDELKQIAELISSQKELNDARNEELINARKAGIEKNISLKYGEYDRAADYAQQEQEALNAAAAKQKDIQANNSQIISLRAGIGQLKGYSQAAIENREAVRNLEMKMLDMVSAYARTGASTEQVRAYAQKLSGQFRADAMQVWKNRVGIQGLIGDLSRYIGVIRAVPMVKPTTVTANVGGNGSGAIGAMQRLGGAADWATRKRTMEVKLDTSWATRQLRSLETQIKGGGYKDDPTMTPFRPGSLSRALGGSIPGFAGGGTIPGRAPSNLSKDNRLASVDGKGLIKVQSEEFIMQKRAVDFWGTDFMSAINSMKMPAFNGGGSMGGRSSGSGAGGPMLVELTAENIAAILRLADRPVDLYAGVEKLASTVAEGNSILASKGVFQ